MEIGEPEAVQVVIDKANIKKFIDSEFLGLFDKEFKDIMVVNLTIVAKTDENKEDMITFAHPFRELAKNDKLVIDADESKTIKTLLNILKAYREKKPE